MSVLDVLSWICILWGCFFLLVGGLGVNIFRSFYLRVHAAGITDSLGATSILVGLMFQSGWSLVTLKLLLVLAFLAMTSPTSTHALVKAAFARGIRLDLEVPKQPIVPGPSVVSEERAGEGSVAES